MAGFVDGVVNFVEGLVARRNVLTQNRFQTVRLTDDEKRAVYQSGIGNKIVRLKADYALKDSLAFGSTDDEEWYRKRAARHVKKAARWAIAFGRGIVVIHQRGDNLAEPLRQVDTDRVQFSVFSGDMVTVIDHERDLQSARYYKPKVYAVRGTPIHHTRVIDFTYVEPPEFDAPHYRYGGVGEFDLIYDQLIADGIVQRASPRVIEKASSLFYKVKGFKEAMQSKRESDMVAYFGRLEDVRGIYAAGIVDAEDEIEVVAQQLSNLSEADQITLRRLLPGLVRLRGVPGHNLFRVMEAPVHLDLSRFLRDPQEFLNSQVVGGLHLLNEFLGALGCAFPHGAFRKQDLGELQQKGLGLGAVERNLGFVECEGDRAFFVFGDGDLHGPFQRDFSGPCRDKAGTRTRR